MHLAYYYSNKAQPTTNHPLPCYRKEIVAAIQAAMATDGAMSAIPPAPFGHKTDPRYPRVKP